jgi:hypothetical protein
MAVLCIKIIVFVVLFQAPLARASAVDDIYEAVHADYPRDAYLVGIGIVRSTGILKRDRRSSGAFARSELAARLRIRVMEESLEGMCRGGGVFRHPGECRTRYVGAVRSAVDELTAGSRIVGYGQRDGLVYSVAAMERAAAARAIKKSLEGSISMARALIAEAKEGQMEPVERAKEEFVRARAIGKVKEVVEGIRVSGSAALEELEKEMRALIGG